MRSRWRSPCARLRLPGLRPRRPGDGPARAAQRPARPGRHPDPADLRAATSDHPASQFVARHGDGVAVVAFGADDAANAYADAVAAGGRARPAAAAPGRTTGRRVVTAEIAGFGDVVYRLVERHGAGRRVPARRDRDGEPAPAPARTTTCCSIIDHVAVCVPAGELDPTIAFHEQVLRLHGHLPGVHRGRRAGHGLEGGAEPVRRRHVHDHRAGPQPPAPARSTTSWPGTTAPGCSTSRSCTKTSCTRCAPSPGAASGSR